MYTRVVYVCVFCPLRESMRVRMRFSQDLSPIPNSLGQSKRCFQKHIRYLRKLNKASIQKNNEIKVNGINSAVTSFSGALVLTIVGFVLYNVNFVVNTIALTIALYVAMSVVVGIGVEPRKLLNVLVISAFFILVSESFFSFLHQFAAFCISLFVLLVMTRYSLIGEHDSGWFGAVCGVVMSMIFLSVVEIILVLGRLFLI